MLKIDRSFVSGLRAGNEPLRLVEGIVALGNTLGLETVAEGVEELEELAGAALGRLRGGPGLLLRKADASR